MERQDIYRGLVWVMWAQLFLYVDFHLGGINVLPKWVGYVLLWRAIHLLRGARPTLGLLEGLCVLLGVRAVFQTNLAQEWISTLPAALEGVQILVGLVLFALDVYFEYQFLTDMAALAGAAGEDGLERSLRRGRDALTVLYTLSCLVGQRTNPPNWLLAVIVLLIVSVLGALLCVVLDLNRVRRCYAPQTMPEEP